MGFSMPMASYESVRMTGEEAIDALPSSIRVGPFDFKIERWTAIECADNRRWGECSCLMQTIRIQRSMPSATKAVDTFLHEVLHAIYFAWGIEDEDKEERTVAAIATAWTQIFRDNPWLIRWIGEATV